MTAIPGASDPPRIYLDNAATSWPKLVPAVEAAHDFMVHCGATAGRGTYASAQRAERWLVDARAYLARMIGAESDSCVAMCSSGTHALNAGLWGVLAEGDHVITTGAEHNSQLRPLTHWQQSGITHSIVPTDEQGLAHVDQARQLVTLRTKLLAIGHASNVTGAVHDLAAWSELASEIGARLLVDASQTIGYRPVDVANIDILAAAGHKGLRALPGTGFLYVAPELHAGFRPLLLGGTGTASEQLDGGHQWPQAVEVGNLNMPGVISLAVGALNVVEDPGQLDLWHEPYQQLLQGLRQLPSVRCVGIPTEVDCRQRIPVLSIVVDGWDVHDLASVLDANFGIEVRAGWHCAALVHRGLGTDTSGGTLRLSPGHSTTTADIHFVLHALREILGVGSS